VDNFTNKQLLALSQCRGEEEQNQMEMQILQQREDLQAVLSTSEGRRFLWCVISDCEVYNYVESQLDEGKRRVGLDLIESIASVSPDSWIMMQKENM
jgi:hypothetical protein